MSKVLFIGIMVTEENNNKVYHVVDNENGTTTNSWGRFQGSIEDSLRSSQTKVYPMHEFEKTRNAKIKKGYKDRTAEFTVPQTPTNTKNSLNESIISKDKGVEQLIVALQNFAKVQTAKTYSVTAKSVTQLQIDNAQASIDRLSFSYKNHFKTGWNINMFNTELLELFSIIPRKMKYVPDHLITATWTAKMIEELIGQEQSNLDSMASQVIQDTAEDEDENTTKTVTQQKTLLETLGLDVTVVTDKKILDEVKVQAQNHAHRIKNVYALVNKSTQTSYDKQLKETKTKNTRLLWHGSRVANWWFIIQQGLRIRPSGAVYSGSMFDDGVYFAIEADKSMGYTDSGRWVNNGNNVSSVFMALYEVNLGKQKIVECHDSSCYKLASYCKSNGYDSVHAKKGPSLMRDELIIYNAAQSTIKYLVEFRN